MEAGEVPTGEQDESSSLSQVPSVLLGSQHKAAYSWVVQGPESDHRLPARVVGHLLFRTERDPEGILSKLPVS